MAEKPLHVLNVVGARPNFMKIAPLVAELRRRGIRQTLLHTGQHYDERMSKVFFQDLGMPRPEIYLGVGSGSHAEQTAAVMVAFEKVCQEHRPDLVVVVGDVNSTLACSIVAAKLWIPVAHVEAGLRSGDREMPEEINRLVTDRLADLLLTPSPDGDENLLQEGTDPARIHRVGNIMIDSLQTHLEKARRSDVHQRLGVTPGSYAAVTLHRPSNVDDPATFAGILDALETVQQQLPIVFPIHPRTRARVESFGLGEQMRRMENLHLVDPLGYIDFLALSSQARMVLTDSGGLQEETTVLGIPCLTLRHNTERPITITEGTNVLVGTDPERIKTEAQAILDGRGKKGAVPALWDGKTAGRIVDVIERWWES